MKKAGIILAAVMALTISGCNEVPEDVRSRTEAKNQAISEAEKHLEERTGEIRYISPDELEDDIKAALGQSYANFTVDPSVKISVPKEIVKCDFKQRGDYFIDPETIYERIFGKNTAEKYIIKESSLQGGIGNYNSFATGIHSEEGKVHFSNWQNGFLCVIQNSFMTDAETGQRIALYHVDRGDDLSDKYLLGDEEISIEEGVTAAQKWLDDNYADLEPYYEVKVKTVIVRQDDNGIFLFDFLVNRTYAGIPIDELTMVYDKEEAEKGNYKLKYREYQIDMKMREAGKIDYFTNLTGVLEPEEKVKLNKVVSLKSAMEYLEKTFADFENPLYFDYVGIKHVLTPQYDFENNMPYNEINTYVNGRIVWEFIMDIPMEKMYEKMPSGQVVCNNNEAGDVRTYIYIDIETGELEFEFDFNQLLQ